MRRYYGDAWCCVVSVCVCVLSVSLSHGHGVSFFSVVFAMVLGDVLQQVTIAAIGWVVYLKSSYLNRVRWGNSVC